MWTPVDERGAYAAEVQAMVQAEVGLLAHWTSLLKEIDPYLELVRASPHASLPGLVPGYYHVLRHNPGAPVSLHVHQGPDGEFREPDSGMLTDLEQSDMWSDRALKAKQKRALDAERVKERNREREAEDRATEMFERYRAATRPSILFPGVGR